MLNASPAPALEQVPIAGTASTLEQPRTEIAELLREFLSYR